jgi:hypothetical protein
MNRQSDQVSTGAVGPSSALRAGARPHRLPEVVHRGQPIAEDFSSLTTRGACYGGAHASASENKHLVARHAASQPDLALRGPVDPAWRTYQDLSRTTS